MEKSYLVLDQYRKESEYNDFTGKFYHFPSKYLNLLSVPGSEFAYYEPKRKGKGQYFGYGRIKGQPFEDKREPGFYFVEIADYRAFSVPVPFEIQGTPREVPPFYNPQNAVRRVAQETLEGICLDGGIQLSFRADAHLMKVIGEQLIASEKVGILELVKNAYDAGASYCKVRIESIPGLLPLNRSQYLFPELDGPVVIVEDNGCGMDRETIENGWLRPASPIKTSIKERIRRERQAALREDKLVVFNGLIEALKKEHGGRIPLGEKGVGRFATHRLGTKLVIRTKTADRDYEFVLRIDWDMFDRLEEGSFVDLDSIQIALNREAPSRDYGKSQSGTQLVIYGGREGYQFTTETIRGIDRTISSLKSPFPKTSPAKFDIVFECPQVLDMKEEERGLADRFPANFTLKGSVDHEGTFHFTRIFSPPSSIPMPGEVAKNQTYNLLMAEKDNWKEPGSEEFRRPECGEFEIRIDAWIRTTPWISGVDWRTFARNLEDYGGISIFRDGLMIFPAQWGAKTDWLELGKRHEKQAYRISYYNLIGNVELSQTENVLLVDKSDREGLVESRPFQDLKCLVRAIVVNVLEVPYMAKRDEYERLTKGLVREPARLGKYSRVAAGILDNLSTRYDVESDPDRFLDMLGDVADRREGLINLRDSLKNLEESLRLMQEVQDLLTEQAGYGLAIGVAVHEISKITANFYHGVKAMLDSGRLDKLKLEELQEASLSIKSELNRLAPQRAVRNEPPAQFDIGKSIHFEHEVYRRRLEKLRIDFQVTGDEGFQVYARYGAVNQVLSNLIDNSCYWLDTISGAKRRIVITIDAKNRALLFADSGPGIHESIRSYLFQPGYSLKIPPSGLGLYICRYYLTNMKGDIYLAHDRSRMSDMPGAQFVVDFWRVPASLEEVKK